ncbi:MAG: hypothetical protein ABI766_08955 [Gemmatimonadales bacterium]
MRGSALLSLALAVSFAVGCERVPEEKQGGPFLEARWIGADSGKIAAPLVAEWCDSLRMLEILAVRGDTGIALALYAKSTFGAGTYPVLPPARADSSPPAASVALRWFAETSIRGFQGDSGTVEVEEIPPGVFAGVIVAHGHSVTDGGKLTIRGTFSHLVPGPAGRGCVPRKPSSDSGASID